MKLIVILALLLTGVDIPFCAEQQDAGRRSGRASINPCPGGTAVVSEIDATVVPSLERLLLVSDLVVEGTVLNPVPAFNPTSSDLSSVETDSMISVTQRLWGNIPSNGSTILLFQLGGKTGGCTEIVPDDPIVQPNERYILFLAVDNRKQVPNPSGVPRYIAPGIWTKAKITNGKIQFQPRANHGLHKYDGMDVNSFLAIVRDRITVLSGYKMLHEK
jgi:hypothetical protein